MWDEELLDALSRATARDKTDLKLLVAIDRFCVFPTHPMLAECIFSAREHAVEECIRASQLLYGEERYPFGAGQDFGDEFRAERKDFRCCL